MDLCIGSGPIHIARVAGRVLASDVVFCWFASVYAAVATLVAALLRKKSVIVVGGADMAGDKEFNYGLWNSAWKSMLVRSAIRRADRVLVVDESLRKEVRARVGHDGGNLEVLPTGHDHTFWQPAGSKEPSVLTVAAVNDAGRFKIKGIDILFDVARKLPDVRFTLIGPDAARFRELVVPANLTILPPMDRASLLPFYQRSMVYCQPSRREGLSNTLCEAMLCGCIPVATDVGGSALAIGETGIVVPPGDHAALVDAIKRALALPKDNGTKGRERIISLFPQHRREERLRSVIAEMCR